MFMTETNTVAAIFKSQIEVETAVKVHPAVSGSGLQ
jgi:hypothetical protein